MCRGYFCGRYVEYLVWVYGDDTLTSFNGIVILGKTVSPHSIKEKDGILFTGLNRTLADALANESILDMQGITEALSKYYYSNGNCFEGLYPIPKYQEPFDRLATNAIEYYDN